MKNNVAEGKFVLSDIVYDITCASISVENVDMEIILYPDVEAKTANENVEYDMRSVHLYHNNGFNIHVSTFDKLKGKKFVWDSEYN